MCIKRYRPILFVRTRGHSSTLKRCLQSINLFLMDALNSHNSFRARHGVSPLVLDDVISRKAQTYAEYLAKNNRFAHSSDRDGLGENLYTIIASRSVMDNSLGKMRSLFSFNISFLPLEVLTLPKLGILK
jgi:hypothetical protein